MHPKFKSEYMIKATLDEASRLAKAGGAGGSPELQAVIPESGMMVMSYCEGTSLIDVLEAAATAPTWNLDDGQYFQILTEVCHCVKAINEIGLVHCDLNLGNMVVRRIIEADSIKYKLSIIDFGLATEIGQSLKKNWDWENVLLEKSWYATETLTGLPVSDRTDIVAIGDLIKVLLEHFLTGQYPGLGRFAQICMSRDANARPKIDTVIKYLESCYQRCLVYQQMTDNYNHIFGRV